MVAVGGVGVVVAEQPAEDLQHLLEERLGLGILPLVIEDHGQVVVGGRGECVIVGQQPAVNLQGLLEERPQRSA